MGLLRLASQPILVSILCVILGLGARVYGLDLAYTSDEGYWLQRTVRFGEAIQARDWAATARSGHPGVTVMWIGLLGIGGEQARNYGGTRALSAPTLESQPGVERLMSEARLEIAIVAAGLFGLAMLLAGRLLGRAGLLGGLLLALDPYTIGMSRLLHVDALLTPFLVTAVLAGLIYWLQGRRWPFLVLSGVMGGLALLTKAPAVALIPYFGIVWLTVAQPWRVGLRSPDNGWRIWLAPLAWALLVAGVYFALWPTLWVRPIQTLVAVAKFAVSLGGAPHLWPTFFLGQPTSGDPGLLFYPLAILLRLGPIAALGLIALAAMVLLRRVRDGSAILWLAVFVIVFVDVMAIGSKKFDRYMLPCLAVLTILGGVGIWLLAREVRGRGGALIVAGALLAQAGWLASTYPYPIAAYNPLLGGTAVAQQAIMIGWGEGLDQTAAYLNALPNAERLTVSTQYHHVLRLAFRGRTVRVPNPRPVDYYVVYVNMIQRNTVPFPVRPALTNAEPVFTAYVDGVPVAWVYRGPFQISATRDVPGEGADEDEDAPQD